MKIVFRHHIPLPVTSYGGAERILFWHMRQLVRLGHHVVLLGDQHSTVEKHGIELIPSDESSWENNIPNDTDILHMQYNYSKPITTPVVCTIHGNGQIGEVFEKNCVFVSDSHAKNHGASQFVHNALDLEEYPFSEKEHSWDNFLFLAKASWSVKNLKHCVKACKKNKKTLRIAGGRSFLPSKWIKSFGLVGNEEKIRLINQSDALLFPVRWHEPFGIAMIEALSQGIPVIGSAYGSLKEIVTPEVGLLCQNYSEFEQALAKKPRSFSPKVIRKYVEDNFGIEKYSKKYLEIYSKVINGKQLHDVKPAWNLTDKPQKLLPF